MWNRQTKYGAHKAVYDGIIFDSRREMRRYQELRAMEKNGDILDLKLQQKFVLIPAQREPDRKGPRGGVIKGKLLERECSYVADFTYREPLPFYENLEDLPLVVEDAKGIQTEVYKIKKKLMLQVYGIRIQEV